jgi:hypothetical protein
MLEFVHYTMWIHHGKTVVNVDLEEEAENLNYIDKYIAELDAQIDGCEKSGGAGGWDGNDEASANDGGGYVRDKDDMVIIWRKCFAPLD